jgi:hypothetical protein
MLVAGPGAPAPTTPSPTALKDQAKLRKIESDMPQLQQKLVRLSGFSGPEARAAAETLRTLLSEKITERNRLRESTTEVARVVEKETALQPLKLEQSRIEGVKPLPGGRLKPNAINPLVSTPAVR